MATRQHEKLDAGALFYTLAEDLKTPLVRMAYKAELAGPSKNISDIQQTIRTTIDLIDAYILGAKNNNQSNLALEPVSPSAVIADTAYCLRDYAKDFACQLIVDVPHNSTYAMTNKSALLAALSAIGKVFIEAQDVINIHKKSVTLSSYKTLNGYAVGVFCDEESFLLNNRLLSCARSHVGKASRPYVGLASGASSQLFVAEQLLQGLHATLRTVRRGKLSGLVIDLLPTSQLTLV